VLAAIAALGLGLNEIMLALSVGGQRCHPDAASLDGRALSEALGDDKSNS